MDDAIAEDGDRGFVGINQRNPLNQLQPGEVRESVNGRIEGYWKPRKAVSVVAGQLTGGGAGLTLPFLLIDGTKTISSASYSSNLVTIVVASGHGLPSGTALGLIEGLTFTGSNGNGIQTLTYVNSTTLTYPVTNVTAVSGTGTLKFNPINDNAVTNVRASCLYSDPNSNNKEYILVALNSVIKKVDLDNPLATAGSIQLPAGENIDENTDMIQAFDKVIVFREGDNALQWDQNSANAFYRVPGGPYQANRDYNTNNNVTFSNGVATVTIDGPDLQSSSGIAIGQGGSTIKFPAFFDDGFSPSDLDDFYNGSTLLIGATTYTINDYNGTTKVATLATGTFTLNTEYTFSALKDNPFAIGTPITITQASSVFKVLQVGDIVNVVGLPTYNTWRFYVSEPNGTHTIHYSVAASIGLGFSHMPAPPWGTYFQRRLWVPFWYESKGTLLVPEYPDRGIRDEILASDILDSNTYDQVLNQFRIGGGTADFTVAMHGFYDDSLVVFNRNSIHLVKGTQGSLEDTVVKELTNEVGCLARKSVVIQGNTLIFLSDNGVYGLEFMNDYNLRGTREPMSKNIQPYIDRINKEKASGAIAAYFDNRYYLAVPLDSKVGVGDASSGNNALLIFNFLNGAWESVDTYGNSGFLIQNLIVGSSGERSALYAVSQNGGVHQIDAVDFDSDQFSVNSTIVDEAIQSHVSTRGYDLNTLERKRFTDAQVQIQTLAGQETNMDISFIAEDPDNSEAAQSIATIESLLGGPLIPSSVNEEETATLRTRIGGVRGIVGSIKLTKIEGSPKVHSLKVAGSVTNRQIISQR
jgi:hypothetical protein